jgi:DNA polymerase-3 subunit delta
MKGNARDLARLIEAPDIGVSGILIHGADAMRIATLRQDLVLAMIGPDGARDMRLTRMAAGDLRRDPAALLDAIKEVGFFPGPRAVLVEDATDTHADPIASALGAQQKGDAQVVVTAGALKANAKLRKLFEASPRALAVAIYDDPPDRPEIEAMLRKAGLPAPEPDALRDLLALARATDPGDFRQVLEKLVLYKWGDASPVTQADLAAVAPVSLEAGVDDLLDAVAGGQADRIGPLIGRLQAQGVAPVTLAIMTTRHFRTLHALAANPGGPARAAQTVRPPLFGPRRDKLVGQAESWGLARLERALSDLVEADLTLRSAARAPALAVIERAMIRLAMTAQRGRARR